MALATNTTPGSIVIAGDLTGTSSDIQLKPSGVTAGEYFPSQVVIDEKGRIVYCTQSDPLTIDTPDFVGSVDSDGGEINLTTTGVTPGSYTYASIAVDEKGRIVEADPGDGVLAGDLGGTVDAGELAEVNTSPGLLFNDTITVDSKGRVVGGSTDVSLAGDVGGTVFASTLSLSGATPGSYTNANVTINNKGIITSASNGSASLSGDLNGTIGANSIASSGVVAGTYTNPTFTVNTKGLISSAVSNPVSAASYTSPGIIRAASSAEGITISGGVMSTNATGARVTTAAGSGVTIVDGVVDVDVSDLITLSGAPQMLEAAIEYTPRPGVAGTQTPDLSLYRHFAGTYYTPTAWWGNSISPLTGRCGTIRTYNGVNTYASSAPTKLIAIASNSSVCVALNTSSGVYTWDGSSSSGWVLRHSLSTGDGCVVWTGSMFIATSSSGCVTSSAGTVWSSGSSSLIDKRLIFAGSYLYAIENTRTANSNTPWSAGGASNVLRSSDGGVTWDPINPPATNKRAGAVTYHDGYYYLYCLRTSSYGARNYHIYRSVDGSTSWTEVYSTEGPAFVSYRAPQLLSFGGQLISIYHGDPSSYADYVAASSVDGGITWRMGVVAGSQVVDVKKASVISGSLYGLASIFGSSATPPASTNYAQDHVFVKINAAGHIDILSGGGGWLRNFDFGAASAPAGPDSATTVFAGKVIHVGLLGNTINTPPTSALTPPARTGYLYSNGPISEGRMQTFKYTCGNNKMFCTFLG